MTSEKRNNPRRPIDILLNKYVGGQPHVCRGVNLSRGGMLVHKLFEPDVPHLSVTVELELPGHPEVLCIEGVVLKAERSARSMAIRFLRMPPRVEKLIEQFVLGQERREVAQATV